MMKKMMACVNNVSFTLLEEDNEFFIYAEKDQKGIKIPIECKNIEKDVMISIGTSEDGLRQELRFTDSNKKELAKATMIDDKIIFEKKEVIARTIEF